MTRTLPPAVQDVAFQLERLVAGMYVYYRQCHKIMKPACVFPIEVELGINLDPNRYESHYPISHDESHDPLPVSHDESHDPLPISHDESHDLISHDESHDVDKLDEDNSNGDLLLPSLALPTEELKPHSLIGIDDLLSLPQFSEP